MTKTAKYASGSKVLGISKVSLHDVNTVTEEPGTQPEIGESEIFPAMPEEAPEIDRFL